MARQRKPAKFHYTYKRVGQITLESASGIEMVKPKYACHKWEDGEISDTYTVVIEEGQNEDFASCDCPAWKKCKHIKALLELFSRGIPEQDLWGWKWDEKEGWQKNTEFEADFGDL